PFRKISSPRASSVSSTRRMKRPSALRAARKLSNAVRALPRCRNPVGLGAKRVTMGDWDIREGKFEPCEKCTDNGTYLIIHAALDRRNTDETTADRLSFPPRVLRSIRPGTRRPGLGGGPAGAGSVDGKAPASAGANVDGQLHHRAQPRTGAAQCRELPRIRPCRTLQ